MGKAWPATLWMFPVNEETRKGQVLYTQVGPFIPATIIEYLLCAVLGQMLQGIKHRSFIERLIQLRPNDSWSGHVYWNALYCFSSPFRFLFLIICSDQKLNDEAMKWGKKQGKGVVGRRPETVQIFAIKNPQSGVQNQLHCLLLCTDLTAQHFPICSHEFSWRICDPHCTLFHPASAHCPIL